MHLNEIMKTDPLRAALVLAAGVVFVLACLTIAVVALRAPSL